MAGFDNSVLFCNNVDFRGVKPRAAQITSDGQLLIGSTASPNIQAGYITSTDGSLTITNGSASIVSELSDISRNSVGYYTNLGISYSGGTFSITSASGSALSATNPAYVTLPSSSAPGRNIVYTITANQTFIDDAGASTIIGNLFGTTTGVAVAVDMPFFIYAVANDSENAISFMISRCPGIYVAPAAAKIGKTGSAVASTQASMFAFGNPTVGDYDGNPCVSLGGIRMRKSAADDWTVQALSIVDGFGRFYERSQFTFPPGNFGAASGKYFADNGGTAPHDTNAGYAYALTRDGLCYYTLNFPSVTTAGVGGVNLKFITPFSMDTALQLSQAKGRLTIGGKEWIIATGSAASAVTVYYTTDTANGTVQNSDVAGGSLINFTGLCPIDTSV